MNWFFKTKEERIVELEAKIQAWDETWGQIKDGIPVYEIHRLEDYKADLYQLRKELK